VRAHCLAWLCRSSGWLPSKCAIHPRLKQSHGREGQAGFFAKRSRARLAHCIVWQLAIELQGICGAVWWRAGGVGRATWLCGWLPVAFGFLARSLRPWRTLPQAVWLPAWPLAGIAPRRNAGSLQLCRRQPGTARAASVVGYACRTNRCLVGQGRWCWLCHHRGWPNTAFKRTPNMQAPFHFACMFYAA
jgi:hypothetical protein